MSGAETSNPLVGTWKLVAFQVEFENLERQDAYDKPCGSLIITADGRWHSWPTALGNWMTRLARCLIG